MSLYKCDKCGKELSSEDFKTGEAIMNESSPYFMPFCEVCHSKINNDVTTFGALNTKKHNRDTTV